MSRLTLLAAGLVLAAACRPPRPAPVPSPSPTPVPQPAPRPDQPITGYGPATASAVEHPHGPIARTYADVAMRLRKDGLDKRRAYERLAHLTDMIGARMAGSAALTRAIDWFAQVLRDDGHENVRTERVMVRTWSRGTASGEVVAPARHPLHLLALGRSPATPAAGVTGQVVIVDGFEALDRLGAAGVKGKIVLFNHAMPPYDHATGSSGYGAASPVRMTGPQRAAALGARAALVRSLTARSLGAPHAGLTLWGKVKPIPAFTVSLEDAELLVRLVRRGPVSVTLKSTSRMLPDTPSANVIAELRGRERPDEIVLLGAHSDSWDVGQGAHDDGAGCLIMIEALTLLRESGLRPRRTVRVVLFTGEETNADGSDAYVTAHAADLGKHVVAIEADSGGFAPWGVTYKGAAEDPPFVRTRDLVTLLVPLGAAHAEATSHAGLDIQPLGEHGVALFNFQAEGSRYFDLHHSVADTLDKIDPAELQAGAVVMAIVAYVIADWPEAWNGRASK
jgi:carboxypeptidase Q